MTQTTMQAMRVERHAPIESPPLVEARIPIPVPGPNEVLIRVSVCGVCHTDLHVV